MIYKRKLFVDILQINKRGSSKTFVYFKQIKPGNYFIT